MRIIRKLFYIFATIAFFFLIQFIPVYFFAEDTSDNFEESKFDFKIREITPNPILPLNISNPKIILFGTKWWFKNYPFLKEAHAKCPQCVFTEDKRLFRQSHVVVFHALTLSKAPRRFRPPNQIWVWLYLEAPTKSDDKLNRAYIDFIYNFEFWNMFNWTMTYRKDSDVYVPYGEIIPNLEMARPSFDEAWAFMPSDVGVEDSRPIYQERLLETPTLEDLVGRRLVAWIVTHCNTSSKREQIAFALQAHAQVDIYGPCGNLSCQFNKSGMSLSGNPGIDCRIELSSKYKFYLALENSVCEDYITEKYFDTYFTQMVPIVYGGVDYEKCVPPNSYISVNDFDSVEELADYLKYLDRNPQEYLKYFEWKEFYWVKNNGYITGYCKLCEKIWELDNNPSEKFYGNVETWWHRKNDYEKTKANACLTSGQTEDFLNKFLKVN